MTPKLRLREQARKALLSCMRKLGLPGRRRIMRSTQTMLAPKTQAVASERAWVSFQSEMQILSFAIPTHRFR